MFALAVLGALSFLGKTIPSRAPTRSAVRASDADFAYGLPGVTSPLGPFDPVGFSKAPAGVVRYFRESELMHSRVGMLAALGFLVQEPIHPLFGGEVTGPAIDHFQQIPAAFWAALVVGIATVESYRISVGYAEPQAQVSIDDPDTPENESSGWDDSKAFSLKDEYTPGDIGFDPLGLKPTDPEELLAMQCKELNNGRLAMLAAAGILAQETVDKQTLLGHLGIAL